MPCLWRDVLAESGRPLSSLASGWIGKMTCGVPLVVVVFNGTRRVAWPSFGWRPSPGPVWLRAAVRRLASSRGKSGDVSSRPGDLCVVSWFLLGSLGCAGLAVSSRAMRGRTARSGSRRETDFRALFSVGASESRSAWFGVGGPKSSVVLGGRSGPGSCACPLVSLARR